MVSEKYEKEKGKEKMEVLNFENFNGWKLTKGKSSIQTILESIFVLNFKSRTAILFIFFY